MTGRELIIYILTNHLEDEVVVETESIETVAERMDVGVATVKAWIDLGLFHTITVNDVMYILPYRKELL